MYTKPIIYKIFSIVLFVCSCISCAGTIITTLQSNEITKLLKPLVIFSGSWIIFFGIVLSLLNLFFSFVSCSSLFTFAKMIEHEQSNSLQPFVRPAFSLPGSAYRMFGSVIFVINLIANIIALIAVTIAYSVSKSAFIALPILPIVAMCVSMIFIYIEYLCRYYSFGTLLEIKSTKAVSNIQLDKLKEIKTGLLRGYCIFLFGVSAVVLIAGIILCFIVGASFAELNQPLIGFYLICGIIFIIATVLANIVIMGCFYDNLAKMAENKLIKYKLI